ncbi:MAG: hypothetical protein ACRDS9_18495 [Pseudonocardiaceae bacterium]
MPPPGGGPVGSGGGLPSGLGLVPPLAGGLPPGLELVPPLGGGLPPGLALVSSPDSGPVGSGGGAENPLSGAGALELHGITPLESGAAGSAQLTTVSTTMMENGNMTCRARGLTDTGHSLLGAFAEALAGDWAHYESV